MSVQNNKIRNIIKKGTTEQLRSLLRNKDIDINSYITDNDTALTLAISLNKPEMVQTILAAGANPNKITYEEELTPLIIAIEKATIQPSIVIDLLNADADVNIEGYENVTPLYVAILHQNAPLVQLLLEHGANVNHISYMDITPLNLAVSKRNSDIVTMLLNKEDIDINLEDDNGFTPLAVAVSKGYADMTLLLLQRGADINVTIPDAEHSILELYMNGSDMLSDTVTDAISHYYKNTPPREFGATIVLPSRPATVFDMEDIEEIPFADASAKDAYIFKYRDTYFTYPIEWFVRDFTELTGVIYACEREHHGAPFFNDVEAQPTYFLIRGPSMFMIPLAHAMHILLLKNAFMFELTDSGKVEEFTAGYTSVQTDDAPGMNQSGNPVNIISADHCQAGTRRTVFYLNEYQLPAQRGGQRKGGQRKGRKTRRRRYLKKVTRRR